MAELKMTKKLTGWFDVKVYNDRQPRENWKLKRADDNISFGVTFKSDDPDAEQFKAFSKPSQDGERVRVTFKIGGRCRWFDAQAQPVEKPANAELDGKQYECTIQYREVEGDPKNPKSPRGYWVNAIQFAEVQQNPFAAMTAPVVPLMAATMPPMPEQQQGTNDDLPF